MAESQNHHYRMKKGLCNHKASAEERSTVLWFRPWIEHEKDNSLVSIITALCVILYESCTVFWFCFFLTELEYTFLEGKFECPAVTIKQACDFGKVENSAKACPRRNFSLQAEVKLGKEEQLLCFLAF